MRVLASAETERRDFMRAKRNGVQNGRRMTTRVARMRARTKPMKSRIVSRMVWDWMGLKLGAVPSIKDGLESLEGAGVLIAFEVEVITAVLEDLDATHVAAIVEDVAKDDVAVLAVAFTGSSRTACNEGFEGGILRIHGVS